MDLALKIARTVLASAGAVFFVVLTVFSIQWVPRLCLHVDGVLTRTEVTLSKVYATMKHVDDATAVWADAATSQAKSVSQITDDVHGVLTESRNAILEARGAAKAAQGALAAIQSDADALRGSVADSQTAIQSLNADLVALKADEDTLNRTMGDVDGQIVQAGPKAQAILAASQALAEESAKTMKDVRTVTDRLADPHTSGWQKFRTVIDLLWKGGMLVK